MKILHVLDYSVPNTSGYASRSQYIVEFQKRLRMDPFVITSPRHRNFVNARESINNISYFRTKSPRTLINKLLENIKFLKDIPSLTALSNGIKKIVKPNAIDIIHAHSPVIWGIAAYCIARRLKIPFVYEVRALWEDAAVDQNKTSEGDIRYKLTHMLETFLFKRADAIVTICEGLKREIISRGINPSKVFVIPNGVDTNKFVPGMRDPIISTEYGLNNKTVIGFIGSFYKFEGLEYLIKAVPDILKATNNVKFMIIGHGKEESAIRKLILDLQLSKEIIFVGKVDHDQILKYYLTMDILVYPRINRRITNMVTPLKPLEAMSMEKSVICSNVGGLKELVEDGKTGLCFESENTDDLVSKCLLLIQDINLRNKLGSEARKNMIKNRDWEKIVAGYNDIYTKCLGE